MASRMRSLVGLARCMHTSCRAQALSEFKMPAMSPTMTQGRISSWKVKEGDSFTAGDVLCTVETDKADIDVEAQDDGIMGKIFLDEKATAIEVGTVIAMLAEEGDDISNIKAPEASASSSSSSSGSSSSSNTSSTSTGESSSSTSASTSDKTSDFSDSKNMESHKSSTHVSSSPSTPSAASDSGSHGHAPKHSMPMMPSVLRLLNEAGVTDANDIAATGYRGRLTKGDVLAHLGRIKHSSGSAVKLEEMKAKGEDTPKVAGYGATGAKQEKETLVKQEVMTGTEFRRSIMSGLTVAQKQSGKQQTLIHTPVPLISFDDILDGYLARTPVFPREATPLPPKSKASTPFDEFLSM